MIRTFTWRLDGGREVAVAVRKPESSDLEALYRFKNDPDAADPLRGFSTGYSHADIAQWIEFHRNRTDEILWAITAGAPDGPCIGHVGLYQIDHRVRCAEFGILVGDPAHRRLGIGRRLTRFALEYGFDMLNLNRIQLTVLSTNETAHRLYVGLGFRDEGVLRQAQFKRGRYVDVRMMSMLRSEYVPDAD